MPTRNPDVNATKRFSKLFHKWQYEEPFPPIVEQVRQVETQRQKAMELLSEVLATLQLEGNWYLFEHAPEDWHTLVKSWRSRYSRLKAKPEGESMELDT